VSRVIAADADLGGLTRSLDRLKTDKVEPVGLDARDQDQVAGLMRQVQAVIVLLPVSFHVPITRLAVANGIHLVNSSYVPWSSTRSGGTPPPAAWPSFPSSGLTRGLTWSWPARR